MQIMTDVEKTFLALSKSKFRSRFKLTSKDKDYINDKGIDVITSHARDFITTRLAPAHPKNDGKQTPMKSHPVFIAQHATATCCRSCLAKWHKIPKGRELTAEQIDYIVSIIMKWIEKQGTFRIASSPDKRHRDPRNDKSVHNVIARPKAAAIQNARYQK